MSVLFNNNFFLFFGNGLVICLNTLDNSRQDQVINGNIVQEKPKTTQPFFDREKILGLVWTNFSVVFKMMEKVVRTFLFVSQNSQPRSIALIFWKNDREVLLHWSNLTQKGSVWMSHLFSQTCFLSQKVPSAVMKLSGGFDLTGFWQELREMNIEMIFGLRKYFADYDTERWNQTPGLYCELCPHRWHPHETRNEHMIYVYSMPYSWYIFVSACFEDSWMRHFVSAWFEIINQACR